MLVIGYFHRFLWSSTVIVSTIIQPELSKIYSMLPWVSKDYNNKSIVIPSVFSG